MGGDTEAGQTYLNYVVPQEFGDAAGFQAGSTFKAFVLAQALMQGVQPDTRVTVPAQEFIPERNFADCDGPYGGAYNRWSGTPRTSTTKAGHLRPLQRHPELGEHLLRQPRGADRAVQALRAGQNMGVDLNDPSSERVPSFTLGVADVSPLEMAEAYATFAGPRRALRLPCRHLDRGRQRQPAQGVRRVLHPGADQRRR